MSVFSLIDTSCVAVDLERELSEREVTLLQNVSSTLDASFEIIARKKQNGMKVFIVFNSLVVPCAIQAIQTLVVEIATVYSQTPNTASPNTSQSVQPPQGSHTVNGKLNEQISVSGSEQVASNESPTPSTNPPVQNTPANPPVNTSSTPVPAESLSPAGDEVADNPDVFERPLSLKGQRHVFLYKCRYNQLKSIIDKNGCWGLRMASLEEKWPCLVVYCAKDRETWMNAFHKIQKLERADFHRRKISDSLKTVDLQKLEDLTAMYGQKYVCKRRVNG